MTGYVVHYNGRHTRSPASSTSSLITGLRSNINYAFSVEATSEHLSGESGLCEIQLGIIANLAMWKYLHYRYSAQV